ncbi:dual specificity protein phosphatase family protein [Microbulbifer sp. THAF38]|uniref:protein-tyrosine phosphatase family protein n=1 Tax=Microbulbifer sp. THAF38 TaxID=2587856 RepID=UPI001268099E|nr:dual specificity protein phosphatase family protein [Microbulbifer sp. THAF38]QFT54214.1 hypothetical protein FIU95_06535 [Microbulbifer sp. THAF38]
MLPTTYKVKDIESGTLTVMAKPASGEWIEDEFIGFARLGINKIVCLLETFEQQEVGLACEEQLCIKNSIEFVSFPIPDRGLPNTQQAIELAEHLLQEIRSGKHIAIHCRAGIGRTGIIAGAILVKSGLNAEESLALISSARGVQVPDTEEQEAWLGFI